jgi:hypothetical protein
MVQPNERKPQYWVTLILLGGNSLEVSAFTIEEIPDPWPSAEEALKMNMEDDILRFDSKPSNTSTATRVWRSQIQAVLVSPLR